LVCSQLSRRTFWQVGTAGAESTTFFHERHARRGPCRRQALGPPTVSANGLTTPRLWTVSTRTAEHRSRSGVFIASLSFLPGRDSGRLIAPSASPLAG
jgi:hypothetical protein